MDDALAASYFDISAKALQDRRKAVSDAIVRSNVPSLNDIVAGLQPMLAGFKFKTVGSSHNGKSPILRFSTPNFGRPGTVSVPIPDWSDELRLRAYRVICKQLVRAIRRRIDPNSKAKSSKWAFGGKNSLWAACRRHFGIRHPEEVLFHILEHFGVAGELEAARLSAQATPAVRHKRQQFLIKQSTSELRPVVKRLLELGLDRDDISLIVDEEIVSLVQTS